MLSFEETPNSVVIARAYEQGDDEILTNLLVYLDPKAQDMKFEEEEDYDEYLRRKKSRKKNRKLKEIYDEMKLRQHVDTLPAPDGSTFFVIPPDTPERVVVGGQSGAGKSYWTATYAVEYRLKFPRRNIFVMSRHGKEMDIAYKGNIGITWMNTKMLKKEDSPWSLEELSEALVIFDDMDQHPDDVIKKGCLKLALDLFANGRKYGISPIWVCHKIADGNNTKMRLEASKFVLYGRSEQNRKVLKAECGLSNQQINRFEALTNTHWKCFNRMGTSYVVTEKLIYIP